MSDSRTKSTQDKIDTVHVVAAALATIDPPLTSTEVADTIKHQVQLTQNTTQK